MEITGADFILRELRLGDAAALQKQADNPNIACFLFDRFPSPYNLPDAIDFIRLRIADEIQTKFAIVIDGELAGVIGIDFRDDIYRKAPLLGYWLGQQYWGKGIMTQAVRLMIDYGFTNLDVVRLQAGVFSNNPASMQVLEKAGFKKEGILRSAIIKNDVILDEHIYGILKSDWAG
ncbi:GNAT family N-acetyltransferase [Mucilaginibacter dorajii]|uniref:GNAT family N-acetyltransferase n=1 Tax=Mucilaginibacter dorajii TaxID=692994 RepID=A0ABP7R5M2_9SPHI|nr:GNAT family protein [Mucilaginibacter dorajii]MCS3737666.1 RimJ/RimL family protein N-acetyltransferase [Mucilaginibacter dorajii]